ncbi:MAG TPA: DsrE family protein [Burkholderiales bacterium]|nr:DsrE family protein [Burkholderiales bacterium]
MRLLAFLLLLAASAAAGAQVVYHMSEGNEQASRALQYLRNHLEADPDAKIVVVGHAAGVDFLVKGAKTAKGNEYRDAVADLQLAGVRFSVCEITLRERGMKREQFLPEVEFVPSGVAEISRLQQREGYAYLKP